MSIDPEDLPDDVREALAEEEERSRQLLAPIEESMDELVERIEAAEQLAAAGADEEHEDHEAPGVLLHVRLPPALHVRLVEQAGVYGVPQRWLVTQLLTEALDQIRDPDKLRLTRATEEE